MEGPPEEHPFFTEEQLAQFHEIETSEFWKLLKRGLEGRRELCFQSVQPQEANSPFRLGYVWGQIQLLTDLLQTGPMVVLQCAAMKAVPSEQHEIAARDFYRGE